MLEGIPDGTAPVLVPQFTLKDGGRLMPLAFIKDVKVDEGAAQTTVMYRQTEMDRLGSSAPVADARLSVQTSYRLRANRIERTDVFTPAGSLDLNSVRLEFATFSQDPKQDGMITRFGSGAVTSFSVEGLQSCTSRKLDHDHDYASDTGPMTALVICTSGPWRLDHPLTIHWAIDYK